jgi:hypothetical protein
VSIARGGALSCLLALSVSPVGCESHITSVGSWTDSGHYLEAESGTLSGGFGVATDSGASGAQMLVAPSVKSENVPGEARAVYSFTVRTPGSYKIWGRIRSPDADHNRFWVRVDDGDWMKWRISVGDIWYWDAFHDNVEYGIARLYPLDVGEHVLTLANCADNVELDQLYYSSVEDDVPVGNDTPCHPPHSIELKGVCELSCGSQGGNQCGTACKDHQPFYAYDCGPSCCYIAP